MSQGIGEYFGLIHSEYLLGRLSVLATDGSRAHYLSSLSEDNYMPCFSAYKIKVVEQLF